MAAAAPKGMDLGTLECSKHRCRSPEGTREKHLRALWAIRRELFTIEAKLVMHEDVTTNDVLVLDSGYQVDGAIVNWVIEHSECGPGFIDVQKKLGGNRREVIK